MRKKQKDFARIVGPQEKQELLFFLVFVSFIYPKVGSEEAGNLKTPTEMDKIRTNDRILSPTKRPGEGQLSKTETFRKYLLNIRKTPQKIVTPPPPTTSTKAKGKV